MSSAMLQKFRLVQITNERVENIVGIGENAFFSFSLNVFRSFLSQSKQNSEMCGKELTFAPNIEQN